MGRREVREVLATGHATPPLRVGTTLVQQTAFIIRRPDSRSLLVAELAARQERHALSPTADAQVVLRVNAGTTQMVPVSAIAIRKIHVNDSRFSWLLNASHIAWINTGNGSARRS